MSKINIFLTASLGVIVFVSVVAGLISTHIESLDTIGTSGIGLGVLFIVVVPIILAVMCFREISKGVNNLG